MTKQLWPSRRRRRLAVTALAVAGLLAALGPAAGALASAPTALEPSGAPAAQAPAVALGVLGAEATASAGCQPWAGGLAPSRGPADSQLRGVSVLSPCSAWAVGYSAGGGTDRVLIEHWDGANWTIQPGRNPVRKRDRLLSVAAVSDRDAWAVGWAGDGGRGDAALIEHWDGSAWSVSPFTPPKGVSTLRGVAAASARDVWVVGDVSDGHSDSALIEHWDGTRWTRMRSPCPGAAGERSVLSGVSAGSRHEAWAVGWMGDGANGRTLTLHWNGRRWRPVDSPDPGAGNQLNAVAVVPGGGAWAVGQQNTGSSFQTLILRWTGLRWLPVPRQDTAGPGGTAGQSTLTGVTAISPFSAWAVGGGKQHGTLILHWDGRSWRAVASPQPGDGRDRALGAVASSPAGDVWAVGEFGDQHSDHPLTIHCC